MLRAQKMSVLQKLSERRDRREGSLGTEVSDAEQQLREIVEFREAIAPRDQCIFFGALDPSRLSFAERMMVKAVRAPAGDFRDLQAIDAWAENIARALG